MEITFGASLPPTGIVYDSRPEILFGGSDEGLFVSVEDLGAIYRFVTNNIIPRFARFFK